MKIKILYFLLITFIGFSCNNCKKQKSKTVHQFTDAHGEKFEISKTPERIISCSPAITEIIFALHEEKKLVGRTNFCVYPPEVKDITPIGGLMDPSLEVILQLKPDLVIASTHFKSAVAQRIEELGIPFAWLLSQESVDGAGVLILNVGQLIGEEDKAKNLWADIQKDMAHTVSMIPQDVKKPTVYYAVGFGKGGDYTAGGNTFISELITMAGGTNIASDIDGWAYNLEALLQNDPDMIMIPESMYDAFCQHDQYKKLSAVKNHHVYPVDHHLVEMNGPRVNIALRTFAHIFYPDIDF